jgi:hypothetical protein
MTIGFALEYTTRRMQELGYGDQYLIKFRHLILQPYEERALSAYNEYFMLVDADEGLRISSDFGLYDLAEEKSNELQYEHFGKIQITNREPKIRSVKFIQVIPICSAT